MRIFLLIFIFLGLATIGFAQTVLPGRNRESTKIWITNGFKRGHYYLTETDSTVTLTTNDNRRPLVVHCSFDKPGRKGICQSEKVSLDCDSCYQIAFKMFLAKKRFHWKLIGTDRYFSKISRKLLLVDNTDQHYFTLTELAVSDDEYKKLLAQ